MGISEELYRNIFLAILCVFITTWMLLLNFTASLLVLGCVVLTLVNVGGFIHFWGLTFLAFVLLAGSKSHVFITFFKVFFLVVLFGLYNGLFVVPVVLSMIGPAAYSTESRKDNQDKT